MREEKTVMFQNRLTKVLRHLGRQAKRAGISCFRVYDDDLPDFPFCIELYGDKIYLAEYKRRHGMEEEEHDSWMEACLKVVATVFNLPSENIFLKLRQRKPGRLGQYQKLESELHEFEVEENGLKFIVNLSDYLDTGLFLDHRLTRAMLRDECQDKKVLNLFAYTGSFSVYAAAGGASEVVTVDLSNTYLGWAGKNLAINGFSNTEKFPIVQADVMQYLKKLEPSSTDIIIMDPPTFSNSKRMDDFLDIQRDHADMINDCLNALRPGGILYFSTNSRKFSLDTEKLIASSIKDITRKTTPFDFEGRLHRLCYKLMK